VFQTLRRDFCACAENFASPFNCYFARFCSALAPVDVPFGSMGSFFDFRPLQGSFECGPPYTTKMFKRQAEHCIALLDAAQRAGRPLSFVVFTSDWTEPVPWGLQLMARSAFLRADFVAGGNEHLYITGAQHFDDDDARKRYYVVNHGTRVFVLQTTHVPPEWACTAAKVDAIRAALAPPPPPPPPPPPEPDPDGWTTVAAPRRPTKMRS
jgi:phosphorylated CTD-interacting factor 1